MSEYWTLDTSLFTGNFKYFGPESVLVRGKVHQEEEQYTLRPAERDIEPIAHLKGTRHYVHCKPFVLLPNITLTIGLYSQQREDQAIGEVVAAHEAAKQREVEIGQVQAWYYPQDTTIMLWECFLLDFARDKPLLGDANMQALWEGFPRFLLTLYPAATKITTTSHDPLFDTGEYQTFLQSLGYERVFLAV